ncbi:MAG: hypothetical protein KKA73_05495 [Chloroflexi bacterium]|nr:hypothetical protein [Chloroflexota bacterium]MBU1747122.1 hypothetical protein [Chloroflexota bacterium]
MKLQIKAGWLSLVCLCTMLISVVWSIQAANWTPGLDSLTPVVLAAVAMGVLLSHLRFSRWFAQVLGLWAAFEVLTLQMAAVVTPGPDYELRTRLLTVGWRLSQWGIAAITGESNSDYIVFVLQLSILLWLVAFMAAWLVFHSHRPWWAIALTAVPLLVNLYYARSLNPNGFLILFTGSALLLLVRHNVYVQERTWHRTQVSRTADARWDLLWTGALLALVLTGTAWIMPGASASKMVSQAWDQVSQPWQEFQMHWYRLFSSTDRGVGSLTRFDGTLQLGGPTSLPDTRALEVTSRVARYWRAVALDHYDGQKWTVTANTEVLVEQGDTSVLDRLEAAYSKRRVISQRYQPLRPYGGLLLSAGEWGQSDRLSTVKTYVDPTSETVAGANLADAAMVYGRFTLFRSSEYIVYSSYSEAYVEDLEEAGTDYPDWMRARFLQLPATLPDRVRNLAETITADAPNPYAKATTIERYLRDNYTYDQTVKEPLGQEDAVDYCLFDIKRGYCTHFASSMVVLCRTVGVPARIVTGYTSGKYDAEAGVYVVLESNAHAWVEVFFPGYGWVEFEPSPSKDALARARRPAPASSSTGQPTGGETTPPEREPRGVEEVEVPPESPTATPIRLSVGWGGWLTLLVVGMLAVVGTAAGAGWWWSLRGLTPIEGVYERMRRFGRLLGIRRAVHQTDHEYARKLGDAVPDGQPEIEAITTLRVHSQFSPHKPEPTEQESIWANWAQLWPKIVKQMWQRVARWLPRDQSPL